MLHILPAKNKKEKEGEDENSNFKKKKEVEQKKKAQSSHNWNALFISQDAVANLMATKYNVDKSQLFDVHNTSKKSASIAVKLAVGETQIVNDIKKFLVVNGVKLDAFNSGQTQRSKTVILIKNLPNNTSEKEVKDFLTKYSVSDNLKRFVMPEYGVAALLEFGERQEARDAFKKLAYRKFKSVPLYLEWAPEDVFDADPEEREKLKKEMEMDKAKETKKESQNKNENEKQLKSNEDSKKVQEEEEEDEEYEENATLFVKNLNFDTKDEDLQKVILLYF